jgi:MraZ protein
VIRRRGTLASARERRGREKRVGDPTEVEIDAAWRVLISPELRKFATLEKQVMLVGQGSHFEIWNQDIWEKQLRQLTAQTQLPPGMEDFAL